MNRDRTGVRLSFRWLRTASLFGVLALAAGACDLDEVLEVNDPDTVNPGTLAGPEAVGILVAGAIGDFHIAYSGSGGDAFLSQTALITDEFFSSGTFTTRTAMDQRKLLPVSDGNSSDVAYTRLHRARRAINVAAEAVAEFESASDARIGELRSLEGYVYTAFAEGFCGSIPFSDVDADGTFIPNAPIGRSAMLTEAVARFDAAASANGGNLAAVGKGRALMNAGQYAAAAAAVAAVPTDFVYFIEHSSNSGRQNNPFFSLQANGRYSLSDSEGVNGLPFRTAMDPRLAWYQDPDGGFDANIPLYIAHKYPDFGSNVVLADGIEARLIEAEADLAAGGSEWLDILNALRADVASLMGARVDGWAANVAAEGIDPTLAPLTDPGSDDARVDMIFSERAFWMWGTGHRLGDMRRLITQYNRSADSVFPTGAYHKGDVYGNDLVFAVEFEEANNENYDASTCITTTP